MMSEAGEQDDLRRQIETLGPWFHNLRIGGVETAPDHFLGDYPSFKWQRFKQVVPADLSGMSVLDIGCNAGFYAIEMKRRNARRVLAIDTDSHYLRQAEFAAYHMGVDIEFRQMSVYDIGELHEKFDIVLFMGVLYHLRHPLLALDLLHEHVVRDLMLFQCMQRGTQEVFIPEEDYAFSEEKIFERADYPKLFFIEHRYAGDPTNWFVPNKAATEAMLRSAGFAVLENPEPEVYLLVRDKPYFAAEKPPAIARRGETRP
ncbi:TIGR04290 family methyltransferase (plasmid) [Rhizobium sp. CB3090]|uniref:TIGR04290 family methyltransferase n=1 Tax=Rhizobium sp. CB3090 TaxID=3039156 RepID=UPI0024B25100|nr:TIGR04290 family methyltransferase [Rhizobium sp. CB3090]WFU11649.1 TIGR04290 family methyltransferase [Rhizobium sp. CB3090]